MAVQINAHQIGEFPTAIGGLQWNDVPGGRNSASLPKKFTFGHACGCSERQEIAHFANGTGLTPPTAFLELSLPLSNRYMSRGSTNPGSSCCLDGGPCLLRGRVQSPFGTLANFPSYFPCIIKNRGRHFFVILCSVTAARHNRTGAGLGGPSGYSGPFFGLVGQTPLFWYPEKCIFPRTTRFQVQTV